MISTVRMYYISFVRYARRLKIRAKYIDQKPTQLITIPRSSCTCLCNNMYSTKMGDNKIYIFTHTSPMQPNKATITYLCISLHMVFWNASLTHGYHLTTRLPVKHQGNEIHILATDFILLSYDLYVLHSVISLNNRSSEDR